METELIQKKKWYRKKWFYASVVIGIVAAIFVVRAMGGEAEPQYEFTMVQKGVLSQTVDATGNVESADELDLRFETSGRIGAIYKQTNQQVFAGEVIVDLQLGELNARVAQYSAGVQKAQANLNKVLAGETNAYISNLKAKLDQAYANLSQIQASSADSVANAEAALQTAENNMKLSEGGENSHIVENTYQDMVALLQSIQNTLAEALTEADNVLGVDNKLANDDFEDELASQEPMLLPTAKNAYKSAKEAKKDVDELLNTITIASPHDDIDWAADTAEEGLFVMKSMLFEVSEVLDKTKPIGGLSQTTLDTLKTDIATARSSINTDYISLIDQTQAISTAKNSYSTYVVAYDQAQKNLTNAQAKSDADIQVYNALVDQAQANYDDAKNPPRQEDVATARAQLREAQASLGQSVAARNKGRIIAPINGVIGKIDAKVGEYVSASDIVVKLVSPHFEVNVAIPETDIVKVSTGDDADITLDAYGEDKHFTGKITEIEIGETVIQDVIYYNVTVSLEDGDEKYKILNGMTANVLFYTEEKTDILYIPQRVVRSDDEGKYVRILNNMGELEQMRVETGLRGDGGLVEIISGLSEGDQVVVKELDDK